MDKCRHCRGSLFEDEIDVDGLRIWFCMSGCGRYWIKTREGWLEHTPSASARLTHGERIEYAPADPYRELPEGEEIARMPFGLAGRKRGDSLYRGRRASRTHAPA